MKRLGLMLVIVLMLGMTLAALPAKAQDAPTLLVWADETRAPILEKLGADFEEEYGAKLVIQQIGFGDIRDQFVIAGPAGEGPDILIGAHDWLGELVSSGLLSPIDLGDASEDFSAAAINGFTYDGTLYGMPYAVENVALIRNTDLVPDAPATWEDVRSVSEELKASNPDVFGYAIQENDPYHAFGLQTAFGGYVFGYEDGVGYNPEDVGIDSEGTIAAFDWLSNMVKDGLTPKGLNGDSMLALFSEGKAGMMIAGPWWLQNYKDSGIPYAVSKIPDGPAGEARPFLGVQGFMVSAFASDPLLAQTFLTEFVATEDVMQEIFEAGGRPPAYLPVIEGIDDPDLLAFGEAGANGLAMPAIPEMSAVWQSWGDAMQLVIQQQEEAEAAFTNAGEQIRAAIAAK